MPETLSFRLINFPFFHLFSALINPYIPIFSRRAFNVLPGCDRREQCPTGGGGGVCLNGGRCIDRWDSFVCECPRQGRSNSEAFWHLIAPFFRSFLPPKCERQIREVTFGHGDVPSNIVVSETFLNNRRALIIKL
jgi:hypothetical protein